MIPAHENPFRMSCIEAIPFHITDQEFALLAKQFFTQNCRGVLVGPHGSGKTTLREQLERYFQTENIPVHTMVLQEAQRLSWSWLREQLQQTSPDAIISIDGLDRISPLLWWRFRRATQRHRGVLATSHVTGRLPLLRAHKTSPALLALLVFQLTGSKDAYTTALCEDLFNRHDGNMRNCLRELYDTWDTIQQIRNPGMSVS